VAKGVIIGEGTVVGANSVVLEDLPANSKAFGNPCKVHSILN
jgi:maltose O-acetyltransferase